MNSVYIQYFETKKLIDTLKEFLDVSVDTGMDFKMTLHDGDIDLYFEIPELVKEKCNWVLPVGETPRLRFAFFSNEDYYDKPIDPLFIKNYPVKYIAIYSYDPLLVLLFINNYFSIYPCFKFINSNQNEIPIDLLKKDLEKRNSAFYHAYLNDSGNGYLDLPDYRSEFIIEEEPYFKYFRKL